MGELLEAIQKVDVSHLACHTAPYSHFHEVHHAVSRELFYQEMNDPIRKSAIKVVAYIEDMEEELKLFEARNLPKCLMHADLHYDK